MSEKVGTNMVVGIEYVLRLDDGEEIDRSEKGHPLEYLHGHGNIIPGLERELIGLEVGKSKQVVVNPAHGYGEYDAEEVKKLPRSDFPPDFALEEGILLEMHGDGPDTSELAPIKALDDDTVTLDFNHPLAGKTLHFSVTVLSVKPAIADELAHGHAHAARGHH